MQFLEQRQFFQRKQFELTPSSLSYKVDKIGQSSSYDISFEHIYKVLLTDKKSKVEHLFLGVATLGLGAASYFDGRTATGWNAGLEILFLVAGAALLLFFALGGKRYTKIKLSDNQYLVLRKDTPNAEQVELFLETLFEQRDAYLIEEYGTINTRLTYNYQLEQFKRLRRLKVWTQSEFETKRQELESAHRLMDMGFDLNSKINQN